MPDPTDPTPSRGHMRASPLRAAVEDAIAAATGGMPVGFTLCFEFLDPADHERTMIAVRSADTPTWQAMGYLDYAHTVMANAVPHDETSDW